ncbi:hypothetical protein [Streptomyces spinosisporus]|uniref:Lipoprotein n=1 Tax=Streptomyces spinosisporus TaxID=2927582 RepID=A0ABS9XUH8_9ACTN|nr:hypothetical protein [Streptomyces spinosisporus]MCI3245705.1 hypothetical protein [Streptomyces spinosisporus]
MVMALGAVGACAAHEFAPHSSKHPATKARSKASKAASAPLAGTSLRFSGDIAGTGYLKLPIIKSICHNCIGASRCHRL